MKDALRVKSFINKCGNTTWHVQKRYLGFLWLRLPNIKRANFVDDEWVFFRKTGALDKLRFQLRQLETKREWEESEKKTLKLIADSRRSLRQKFKSEVIYPDELKP